MSLSFCFHFGSLFLSTASSGGRPTDTKKSYLTTGPIFGDKLTAHTVILKGNLNTIELIPVMRKSEHNNPSSRNGLPMVVSIGAFAILSAFCGVGLAWMVIAAIANYKNHAIGTTHVSAIVGGPGDAFVANSIPILVVAGVIGFFVGLAGSSIALSRKSKNRERKVNRRK